MKKFLWVAIVMFMTLVMAYLDYKYVIPFYWSPGIRYTDMAYTIIAVFAFECLIVYWAIEKVLDILDR